MSKETFKKRLNELTRGRFQTTSLNPALQGRQFRVVAPDLVPRIRYFSGVFEQEIFVSAEIPKRWHEIVVAHEVWCQIVYKGEDEACLTAAYAELQHNIPDMPDYLAMRIVFFQQLTEDLYAHDHFCQVERLKTMRFYERVAALYDQRNSPVASAKFHLPEANPQTVDKFRNQWTNSIYEKAGRVVTVTQPRRDLLTPQEIARWESMGMRIELQMA